MGDTTETTENLDLECDDKPIEIPMDKRLDDCPPVRPRREPGTFDPLDGLSKEDEYECIKKAVAKVEKTHDKQLSLMKSDIRFPNQEYLVCSFVGPKCKQKTKQCGIKVFAACPDIQTARKYAQFVNNTQENEDFDVYVIEMYAWCLIPPDPEACENVEYHDKKLDLLIKQHKAQKYKAKEVFDLRKHKLCKNSTNAQLARNNEEQRPNLNADADRLRNPVIDEQLDSNKEFFGNLAKTSESNENNELQRDLIMPSEPMPQLTMEPIE